MKSIYREDAKAEPRFTLPAHRPYPSSTTRAVRAKIRVSRPSDQRSMYSRSMRIQSAKPISLRRGWICHSPVMTGLIDRRRCFHKGAGFYPKRLKALLGKNDSDEQV